MKRELKKRDFEHWFDTESWFVNDKFRKHLLEEKLGLNYIDCEIGVDSDAYEIEIGIENGWTDFDPDKKREVERLHPSILLVEL